MKMSNNGFHCLIRSETASTLRLSLIASCRVWSTQPMLTKPPSQIAAVILAALSLTKQLIFFLSISQVSKIDSILLRRFCAVCLSHIGNVSRTANLRLNFSSMKCAVMLRYESTARDVQQAVVSAKNAVDFTQVFTFSMTSLYTSGMIFSEKACNLVACIADP